MILNVFRKNKIIQSIFYDHNGMEVEINSRGKSVKYVEIKQHSLENNRSKKKALEKLGNTLK